MRTLFLLLLLGTPQFCVAQVQKEDVIAYEHPSDKTRVQVELKRALFTLPKDWIGHRAGPPNKSACILTFGPEGGKEHEARIDISIGISKLPTSKELAESWASEWKGGTVQKEAEKLDGEEVFRVTIPADGTEKPTEALLLVKDKRAYMLMGGAKKDSKELTKALNEIQKTWKWKPE